MILVRRLLGEVLRQERLRQGRTLRDVSAGARVSLGYISEIERGQKEASSECLAAICGALRIPLSVVLADVSGEIAREEAAGSRIASLAARAPAPSGGVQDLAA
ncbi:MAG: helix-turn-helix transcriptional regulator [Nocardioidaceae bacterium]